MGKAWLVSIATVCALVGLSIGCAGNGSPLAAGDVPVAGRLAGRSAPPGQSSGSYSESSRDTLAHRGGQGPNGQRLTTSPLFANGSGRTPPSNRLVSGIKENSVTAALSAFAQRGAELLTPKPRVIRAGDKSPRPGPELYTLMAKASEANGNEAQAAKLYQKALDIAPNDLDAISGYAHLLDRQEQFDEAVRLYRQVAGRAPNHAPAHNDLGLCYARQGMLAEAIQSLERAILLQPRRELYRNNVAVVLTEIDRTDEALSHLTSVYGEAVAHYNVGYLLHVRGEDRRAVGHFAQALRHNPSLNQAQLWLNRLGDQFVSQILVEPTVEVTDLPKVMETTENVLAPAPARIPFYLQQHQSQASADHRHSEAADRGRTDARSAGSLSAGSLRVPSQIPDDDLSEQGALPPLPKPVETHQIPVAPQPLPPVSEDKESDSVDEQHGSTSDIGLLERRG